MRVCMYEFEFFFRCMYRRLMLMRSACMYARKHASMPAPTRASVCAHMHVRTRVHPDPF